jgi:hypothetical protein
MIDRKTKKLSREPYIIAEAKRMIAAGETVPKVYVFDRDFHERSRRLTPAETKIKDKDTGLSWERAVATNARGKMISDAIELAIEKEKRL